MRNGCDNSPLVPNMYQTAEESSFIADRMSEIEACVNEMTMKFILGQESLDNFDACARDIEKLGIADGLSLKQAAYSAKKGGAGRFAACPLLGKKRPLSGQNDSLLMRRWNDGKSTAYFKGYRGSAEPVDWHGTARFE
ncbi:MAG: hypothetical protein Q4G00_02175 [Clostridia bacterium]|nr:hypothetical protein [Clostridia bacterium]